jgi:hypothetical protein
LICPQLSARFEILPPTVWLCFPIISKKSPPSQVISANACLTISKLIFISATFPAISQGVVFKRFAKASRIGIQASVN